MPFVKLDCGILNSTLWLERELREVFITALLMAEPFETVDPLPQIEIQSLTPTGWVVPPGWYGFVPAAGIGILHRAHVPEQPGLLALEKLGAPEYSSRSPEFEGRRLVRVHGGFIILNYIRYRERDITTATRSRRWRERQKAKQISQSRVTNTPTRVIRHQAEAEAEVQVHLESTPQPPAGGGRHRYSKSPQLNLNGYAEFVAAYPVSRRVGGQLGRRAFEKALQGRNDHNHLALMLTALEQQKASTQWQNRSLIPLMTTWLNQERWLQTLPSAWEDTYDSWHQECELHHQNTCNGHGTHLRRMQIETS